MPASGGKSGGKFKVNDAAEKPVPGCQAQLVPRRPVRQKRRVIIDAHVHLYPDAVASDPAGWARAAGEAHWALLCTRRRQDGRPVQTFPTVDSLLRTLDAAGIDRAVLLGWYWERPETCAMQNRFYAACVRTHPDRLSAFATVHPAAGASAARAEMNRARDEGLGGLGELSPHSQRYAVDDPVLAAILAHAGELRWPVNLHVTDPASRAFPGRVETPPDDFIALARRWPETRFVLAHWGGQIALTHADAVADCANLYYDTAASPLLYDAGCWPRLLAVLPPERVLFGSDFPLNLYPRLDPAPRLDRFVAEARAGGASNGVLGGNARALLSL